MVDIAFSLYKVYGHEIKFLNVAVQLRRWLGHVEIKRELPDRKLGCWAQRQQGATGPMRFLNIS